MLSLGVDPGFAALGWTAMKKEGNITSVVEYGCIKTKPTKKVLRHGIRVTDDDARRTMELSQKMFNIIEMYQPDVIGVEGFFLQPGKRSAWKTVFGYSTCLCGADHYGVTLFVFTPGDVKKFTGDKKASKEDVRTFLSRKYIPSFDWGKILKGDLEHIGDSAALSILAMQQLEEYRTKFGLR